MSSTVPVRTSSKTGINGSASQAVADLSTEEGT